MASNKKLRPMPMRVKQGALVFDLVSKVLVAGTTCGTLLLNQAVPKGSG